MIRKSPSILGTVEDQIFQLQSKEEEQLLLPFGPPTVYTIMVKMSDRYYREWAGLVNGPQMFGFVLARIKNHSIRKDGDGDYKVEDLDISHTVTLQNIWDYAQENPEKSIEDFFSQKFMEKQMGV